MPLSHSDFPSEVQVAFFMFSLLSDVWDGTSGMYMGKDWSSVDFLFRTYEIDNPRDTIYFMKLYERQLMSQRAEEIEKKQKEEERKAKQNSGKQYTHNVQR